MHSEFLGRVRQTCRVEILTGSATPEAAPRQDGQAIARCAFPGEAERRGRAVSQSAARHRRWRRASTGRARFKPWIALWPRRRPMLPALSASRVTTLPAAARRGASDADAVAPGARQRRHPQAAEGEGLVPPASSLRGAPHPDQLALARSGTTIRGLSHGLPPSILSVQSSRVAAGRPSGCKTQH